MKRIRTWIARRRLDRLWKRHAEWTGFAISAISRTNPTLASVTWARARQMMHEQPVPVTLTEAQDRLVAVMDLVMAAVDREQRRLEL